MSYLPWVLLLVVAFLTFVVVVGKQKWDTYANMARIRPDERIVHEEKDVLIRTKAWAAFPFFAWAYAGGGPEEYGSLRADVIITDERLLVFRNGVPCSIVDFTRQETLPNSWLAWREEFLMSVMKSDIQVTEDESGKSCLEVVYEPQKGNGIRKRFYLRELEVARGCFPQEEQHLVAT